MAKILVFSTSLFFVFYGVAFTLFPAEVASIVTGAAPSTSSGLIDMRATYGGMSVAVGLTLLLLAAQRDSMYLALKVTAVVLLCMAASRMLGMLTDGDSNTFMVIYLVAELVFGGVALLLQSTEKLKAEG
jgi:hypothetical protein